MYLLKVALEDIMVLVRFPTLANILLSPNTLSSEKSLETVKCLQKLGI